MWNVARAGAKMCAYTHEGKENKTETSKVPSDASERVRGEKGIKNAKI